MVFSHTSGSSDSASNQPSNLSCQVLIVYDSHGGNTARMAQRIARGVDAVPGCTAAVRAVPKAGNRSASRLPEVPDSGAPYVSTSELAECDALIIGSPTHFGNMSASLKLFLDSTTPQWMASALSGKPGAVFTSTGSMHGGQESTLLSMMIPLLHHGMLICGIPYSNPELRQTTRGGTPYGASHVSGDTGNKPLHDDETALCKALGRRVAETAKKLRDG